MGRPNGRPSSRPKTADPYPGTLDRRMRSEHSAKIHDLADAAYSTYARVTVSRRDNLRHIADELQDASRQAEKEFREENLQAGISG